VLNAFHAVADGQKFFCNRVLDLLMENKVKKNDFTEGSTLSPREIQIIRHISEGLSTQQSADKLHLSPHTINAHRKNILKKLDANTPIELIVKALRLKIVPLQ
jgi:DNA-binding NarL/FixJ family response regulator